MQNIKLDEFKRNLSDVNQLLRSNVAKIDDGPLKPS